MRPDLCPWVGRVLAQCKYQRGVEYIGTLFVERVDWPCCIGSANVERSRWWLISVLCLFGKWASVCLSQDAAHTLSLVLCVREVFDDPDGLGIELPEARSIFGDWWLVTLYLVRDLTLTLCFCPWLLLGSSRLPWRGVSQESLCRSLSRRMWHRRACAAPRCGRVVEMAP